jgi:methylthioribose-1-phosphate isomerase
MRINGRDYRTIWPGPDGRRVEIIDQTRLPHRLETRTLATLADAATAISDMWVRGAPLIGVTGAYGLALAAAADPGYAALHAAYDQLLATRPTAVNLRWALDRAKAVLLATPEGARAARAFEEASRIAEEDVACCDAIGAHGAGLIEAAKSR